MAFIQRFSTIDRGGIQFIGNTLGLSKGSNANIPGTLGSIGAFTSLNATQVSTFPVGTTLDYIQNGSSAILNLPVGSSVLYAELVWGGLFRSQTQNISNLLNNPITLTINNQDFTINSDVATRQDLEIPSSGNFDVGFYVRTADVTNIVSNIINGTYSVKGVPALIVANDNQTSETNHAGWTLAVIYRNNLEVLRNLTLWAGGAAVGPNTPVTDITLTGFQTPQVLPIVGKAFISAQEGDAILTGDQFLFGKDVANLTVMSGPNNPANNFFCSQINNQNGVLDTTGTFGNRNANASAGTNISAGRQGWDITAVDISSTLETSQTSALLRFTSSGDLYVPNVFATQIDSLGASLSVTKSVDADIKVVNEEILYTIIVEDTGQLEATNVLVSDVIPEGLTLVSNSIYVDGVLQPDIFPINLGYITPGQSKVITYKLIASAVPIINPVVNIANINYTFQPFPGYSVNIDDISNPVSVAIVDNEINLIKTVDKAIAEKGDELLYTSFIYNNGSIVAQNIIFIDDIPLGTTYIDGSVIVDGVSQPTFNPAVGFNVGTLNPNQVRTISYKVIIN